MIFANRKWVPGAVAAAGGRGRGVGVGVRPYVQHGGRPTVATVAVLSDMPRRYQDPYTLVYRRIQW
jgi:hypothetical protein